MEENILEGLRKPRGLDCSGACRNQVMDYGGKYRRKIPCVPQVL